MIVVKFDRYGVKKGGPKIRPFPSHYLLSQRLPKPGRQRNVNSPVA
jgi:hypothetical protein